MRSKGGEGGRSEKWDKVLQAQKKDPGTSFHIGVCDVAAADLRKRAGKHKLQLIGASCDRWIIYVTSALAELPFNRC